MARNRQQVPRTNYIEKKCAKCGAAFHSWKSSNRRYCSLPCSHSDNISKMVAASRTRIISEPHKTYSRGRSKWVEVGGQRFFARSTWEANYAMYLEWQKSRGEIISWQHEPETFWFDGLKRGSVSYLPDFKVKTWDESFEYHEVKGWMDPRSKTKIKRMAKYHPKVRLIVIDQTRYRSLAKTLCKIVPGWI